MCGGDQTEVDFDRGSRAYRIDLPVLDCAKQLDLQFRRQISDFIQEQRACVCLDELADVSFGRAGERSLFVAEQDAFDQIVRDGPTIDGHERFGTAIPAAADCAGDQFLTHAGLAFDQDRNAGRSRLLGEPDHPVHGAAAGEDVLEGQRARKLPSWQFFAASQRLDLQRVRHCGKQAFW